MGKMFFIVVVFFFCLLSNAQKDPTNPTVEFNRSTNTVFMQSLYKAQVSKKVSEEYIKGNKYHHEDYKIATVFVNDKALGQHLIRYNAYDDEVEILQGDEVFSLQNKDNILVVLENYTYKILKDNTYKKRYYVDFNNGKKTSLVLRAKKIIKRPVEPQSGLGGKMLATFDEDYKYYIKNLAGNLIPVKLKKKEIFKVLVNKKSEVEKFASSKKLSFKKEADVVKIIDYYNTL